VGTQENLREGFETKVMKERTMQSAKKGRFKMSNLAAAAVRGAFAIAVLSSLLAAVRPAQAQTENVLWNFTSDPDGASASSSITSNGSNFYGTTYSGGLGYGTVFELAPNGDGGWTETVLYSFCSETGCADGENPTYAGVVFDSKGNIYGTTYGGGANGYGTVYELSPPTTGTTWTETVLYSFANSPDGANPVNSLIWDASGNLYGVTYAGGNGNGAVFELSPPATQGNPWTEAVIADISATYAGLTINSTTGDIFGAAYGSVFELSPKTGGGWTWNAIFTFTASKAATEGSNPNGTPALDSSGNVYGTTTTGGTYGYGTVYRLKPAGTGKPWTEKLLISFDSVQANPYGGIVFDPSGNIYGTTTAGGKPTEGTVYELVAPVAPNTNYKIRPLLTFSGENGNTPYDGLIYVSGYLYGSTYLGGADGFGTVFVVNPNAAVTTTTLTSSVNPSTEGESVTFTATVSPAPPNGEAVVFEPLGQSPMTNGVATWTTSTLKVGTTKVRAVYEGDLNFITSMSAWLSQVVDQ
jgi:uncharacterized repeat protein (TIGR03803 family)